MARIVYGLSGEGSGHSYRSRIVIKHLINTGHEVKVVSYGKAYSNLKNEFDVFKIEGLTFVIEDNRISKHKTIAENFQTINQRYESSLKLKQKIFKEFRPECVITDFEPMTAYFANQYDIPLITIDNQHRLRYLNIDFPPEMLADSILTKNLIRLMIPRPDISLIVSFYQAELHNERSFLFSPLVGEDVRNRKPTNSNHILVYLTAGFESLIGLLKAYGKEKFIIYGYEKEQSTENLLFKKRDRDSFLSDLASCKAVFATAGFTLMAEAFYLRKPYCAFPLKGQFEQIFNGYLLEKKGFGRTALKLEKDIISSFLYHLDDYKQNLEKYDKCGNEEIFAKLDEIFAFNSRLLHHFHNKRRTIFAANKDI